MRLNPTVILGAGGFAREVAMILEQQGHDYIFASDDTEQWSKEYLRGRCAGSIESIGAAYGWGQNITFIPGIGNPNVREQLCNRALAQGWHPGRIISGKAMLDTFQEVPGGTVICSGVSATVNVTIGRFVNVNLNCTLGHDSVIADYANLSPGVHVSGNVYIGPGADIGTGAVLLPGVKIGRNAVVGAGAVVTKDVPDCEVWMGCPAKFYRTIG
jgi:sugar O-acyltransferase (sialic acid O-acetyltransferase NeuD family)